jgi:hypothetical protein
MLLSDFSILKRKAIPATETSPVITEILHSVQVLLLTVHVISETRFPLCHMCCCVSILPIADEYVCVFPSFNCSVHLTYEKTSYF